MISLDAGHRLPRRRNRTQVGRVQYQRQLQELDANVPENEDTAPPWNPDYEHDGQEQIRKLEEGTSEGIGTAHETVAGLPRERAGR